MNSSRFIVAAGGCILLVVSGFGVATGQDNPMRDTTVQACVDARWGAQEEMSATEWFFSCCMPNGLTTTRNDEPQALKAALVGKDKKYVDRHIECFQTEVRAVRKR